MPERLPFASGASSVLIALRNHEFWERQLAPRRHPVAPWHGSNESTVPAVGDIQVRIPSLEPDFCVKEQELICCFAALVKTRTPSKARHRNPQDPSSHLRPVRIFLTSYICSYWRCKITDFCLNLGPYHPAGQHGAHSLPGLAELSQTHGNPHQAPSYSQHGPAPSHGGGQSLPGFGQAMQHPSPQSINQERERDSRERELLERQRQEEMVHREREQREREREQIERQHLERHRDQQHHPVQSHTGSIPLHQPVASKVPNTIHGPGGLLSSIAANPPNAPQGGMQASGGPGGIYGSQIPHGEGTPRSYAQHAAGPPGQPMMAFNGSGPSIPGNVAALAQGQQPILNVSKHLRSLGVD